MGRTLPWILAGALTGAGSLPAQAPPADVLIVGTYHFHNPGLDVAKFTVADVLTPTKQAEIQRIVDALARFRPTRIAVEQVRSRQGDSLRAQYRRFRDGQFTLTRNEVHQLSFRLAARFQHDSVYPVDYTQGMDINGVLAYARERDTAFARRFADIIGEVTRTMNDWLATKTVGEILREMNTPAYLRLAQTPYMEMAAVGAEDGWKGASVVADWYERNLKMFANLAAIARPGERILFVVGQGHAPILRHLVENHPGMRLVDPLAFLPER